MERSKSSGACGSPSSWTVAHKTPWRGFDVASKRLVVSDYAQAGITVTIDARQFEAIGRQLQRFDLKQQNFIVVQSLNKAMDRMNTRIKRLLVKWSGILDKGRVDKDIKKRPAYAGRWASAILVSGKHTRITTAHYGAKWKRQWPGVKHRAWGRREIADHAWLSKKGIAFRRVGESRKPIVPLFGPSMAREVDRHKHEVQQLVDQVARKYIAPEMTRLMGKVLGGMKVK